MGILLILKFIIESVNLTGVMLLSYAKRKEGLKQGFQRYINTNGVTFLKRILQGAFSSGNWTEISHNATPKWQASKYLKRNSFNTHSNDRKKLHYTHPRIRSASWSLKINVLYLWMHWTVAYSRTWKIWLLSSAIQKCTTT